MFLQCTVSVTDLQPTITAAAAQPAINHATLGSYGRSTPISIVQPSARPATVKSPQVQAAKTVVGKVKGAASSAVGAASSALWTVGSTARAVWSKPVVQKPVLGCTEAVAVDIGTTAAITGMITAGLITAPEGGPDLEGAMLLHDCEVGASLAACRREGKPPLGGVVGIRSLPAPHLVAEMGLTINALPPTFVLSDKLLGLMDAVLPGSSTGLGELVTGVGLYVLVK